MSVGETIGDLSSKPRSTRPQVARAKVVRPPTSLDSTMSVVLVNYSKTNEYELAPRTWRTSGTILPSPGDLCLALFDDDGDIWALLPGVPNYGKGVAIHLEDEDYPRPLGFTTVEWVGTVEPLHAELYDTLIDPTGLTP